VRRHSRRIAAAAAIALLLLLGTAVVVGTALDVRHDAQTSYVRTWLYTFNLRQPLDNIAKGRLAIWDIVGRMIADHPVYGVGPGQLFDQFPRYLTPEDRFSPGTTLSAHNTFLSITAELGLMGLAAWLVVLFAVYRSAFDPASLLARESSTWTSLGLASGLAAYGLTMMTGDRTVLREDVAIFAAMGALAAAGRAGSGGSGWAQGGAGGDGWRRSLRRVMAVTLTAVLIMTAARALVASRGIDATEMAFGLYGPERDPHGVPFRWTSGAAIVPVRADARRVTIRIRKIAPITQRIQARFDDRLLHDAVVSTDGWRSFHYVVPPSDLGRRHYVRIEVTPTWPLELQARPLGVMLQEIEVEF
ncbi:MAG: O-antigen ligase family protein, partial [Vicinamibacteraceae bacterium]